ncbi:hypothetical protein [Bradyrhizobium sp. USDA 4369]
MVDEVFALSPISARAAQPNEADYEAIRDAFMETSRGRWFLGEYAKRNRNADTSMVLDAVARIEHALASQRQQQQEFERTDDKALPEALAAIRAAVEDAALAAASAVDSLALEQNLAPVRKGTRIIKEISWRWREIGADSRICDLIDSQVTSIEAACEQLASTDPKVALLAAFEIIKSRLAELDRGDGPIAPAGNESASPNTDAARTAETTAPTATAAMAPAPPAEEATQPVTQPEAAQKVQAAMSQLVAAVAAIEQADTPPAASGAMPAAPAEPAPAPASNDGDVARREAAKTIPVIEPELEPMPAEALDEAAAAEAQDQAILELVAAEMGAPDPFEDEEFSRARTLGFDIEEPTAIDDDIVASFSEPAALTPAPVTSAPMTDAPVTPAPTTQAPMTPAPLAAAPLMAAPLAPEPMGPGPMAPEPALAPAEVAAAKTPIEAPAPAVTSMSAPSTPATRVELSTFEVSVAIDTEISVAVAPAAERTPAPPPSNAALDREALATIVRSTAQAMPKPAYEPSLGSTLLSNGLLQRQQPSGNDPLTPIRRMSQPEKIAFFS